MRKSNQPSGGVLEEQFIHLHIWHAYLWAHVQPGRAAVDCFPDTNLGSDVEDVRVIEIECDGARGYVRRVTDVCPLRRGGKGVGAAPESVCPASRGAGQRRVKNIRVGGIEGEIIDR